MNETIFSIHHGRFRIFMRFLFQSFCRIVTMLYYLVVVGQFTNGILNFLVVLEQFYGKIACGELTSHLPVLLEVLLHFGYCILDVGAVVDVYMSNRSFLIGSLIHLNHGGEQLFNAVARLEYSRHKRESEQLTQFVAIELVASCFNLVIHIERTHHKNVHINELRCQV